MHAADLLAKDVPPLKPTDLVAHALDRMEEFKVTDLPVVENGRLLGLLRESVLQDRNDARLPVSALADRYVNVFVRSTQHLYEVMKVMSECSLSLLPVLDGAGNFLGHVSEHETLRRLAEITNIHEPGSVVVLEIRGIDYSLQEIARFVEEDGARVLSVYAHALRGTDRMEVTLKINREDIGGILQTFERFGYQINSSYQGSRFHDDLRDRFDELMRFIDL
jgi:acetoin utilization protein AcuB